VQSVPGGPDSDVPRYHPSGRKNPDVVIYAGATILGRVRIGTGAVIGGNVWVTTDVAAGARVTQVQARRELFAEGAGI